jgi:ribosomal protein L12E/L44/L45/RPP1/RPP2
VWTSDNNFSVPLERPAAVADKLFLDGKDLEDALAARAKTIAAIARVASSEPGHHIGTRT